MKRRAMLIALFLLLGGRLVFAQGPVFNSLHPIQDSHCPAWTLDRFHPGIDYNLFVGAQSARQYGFTYEIPISRDQGDVLWCSLNPDAASRNRVDCGAVTSAPPDRPFAAYAGKPATSPQRFADMEKEIVLHADWILQEAAARGGSGFDKLGDVLELLTPHYLQEEMNVYPADAYRIDGGVEYRRAPGERTIGELDVIVYERDSCRVVAVGEVKYSSPKGMARALAKARNQIQRFQNFISGYFPTAASRP